MTSLPAAFVALTTLWFQEQLGCSASFQTWHAFLQVDCSTYVEARFSTCMCEAATSTGVLASLRVMLTRHPCGILMSSFRCCQLTLQNASFWIAVAEHHQPCADSVPTLDCCLFRCITDCYTFLWFCFLVAYSTFCGQSAAGLKWARESKAHLSVILNEWKWLTVVNPCHTDKKRSA